MTFKTRELTVDLVNEISTNEIRFSQGDENSAKLVLNLTNQGQELDLSKATAVRITFEKSDGKTVFQQDCQVINAMKGKYQIVLKTQTLAVIGNVYGQVQIIEGDQKIDSQVFVFTVKRSLSSNQAIESKNEFTIIQRALEVGEQFKGVDFAPIIAAGSLAQGSLPKAGGTMTGNIDMDIAVGSKSKGIRWKDATGTVFGIESSTTGELILYDYKSAARIWQYDPVAKRFTVLSDTNLLKTTGGTITGTLVIDKAQQINFNDRDGVRKMTVGVDGSGRFYAWNETPGRHILLMNADGTFTVNADNLVKKGGDTMTGNLDVPRVNTSNAIPLLFNGAAGSTVSWKTSVLGEGLVFTPAKTTGATDWDDTKKVVISSKGEIIAQALKTPKDGTATLTLTTSAVPWGSSYPPVAVRRGNTVTVRMAITRNSEASNVITNLPADMRPSLNTSQTILASDGTAVTLAVAVGGDISVITTNKNFNIALTYVVD